MRINYLMRRQIWGEWLAGKKPRYLAKKYGVSINTIRSWHYREAWALSNCALALNVRRGLDVPYEVVSMVSKRRKKRISATQKARLNKKSKL